MLGHSTKNPEQSLGEWRGGGGRGEQTGHMGWAFDFHPHIRPSPEGNKEGNALFNRRKEGNVLFNDALNTFYLRLYGVRHMVKDHSDRKKETCCRHMGYSFRLAARVLWYASSHRQDNTYHGLCYTSRGALAGTRNSSMGPRWRIDPTIHRTMSERSYHGATSRSLPSTKNPEQSPGEWRGGEGQTGHMGWAFDFEEPPPPPHAPSPTPPPHPHPPPPRKGKRQEMLYLMMYSDHFIYGYLLYSPSYKHDST